jgi:hypothetical protein
MQFPPSQSVFLAFRSFPVTPGADYEFDVPLSVSANGERAGYTGLVFLDGGGKWVRVDPLGFRPSVRHPRVFSRQRITRVADGDRLPIGTRQPISREPWQTPH